MSDNLSDVGNHKTGNYTWLFERNFLRKKCKSRKIPVSIKHLQVHFIFAISTNQCKSTMRQFNTTETERLRER